ncbi:TPA: hypothetical protein ACX3IX_004688, partial [Vibrio parahaemolyticus]
DYEELMKLIFPFFLPEQVAEKDSALEWLTNLLNKRALCRGLQPEDSIQIDFYYADEAPSIIKTYTGSKTGEGLRVGSDESLLEFTLISKTGYEECSFFGKRHPFENEFLHYVNDVLLSLLIACPGGGVNHGVFEVVDGIAWQKSQPYYELLSDVGDKAWTLTWPNPSILDPYEVLEWLNNIKGFDLGCPEGQVGRAVSAFTQFAFANSELKFVWCLVGLEALYGRDQGGKTEQLLKKSELLLGERKSDKRALNSLYNFRSRLLHGDVNFPLAYSQWDGVDGTDKFYTDVWKAEDLAVAVLWCSLQQLVVRKKSELNFRYEII